jgi:DnaJ-class molecular chaperone
MKNFYNTLGVYENASQSEIEFAYRQRVRDLQRGYDIGWMMRDLQEAFAVLGHPQRRRAYDRSRHAVQNQPEPLSAAEAMSINAPEPLVPINKVSLMKSFRTFHPSFEEIYDRLWSNFTAATRPKAETLRSLTIEIPITPQQAMTGGTAHVMVPAQATCRACGGHGGVGPFVCVNCDGRGVVADEYSVPVSHPAGFSSYTTQVHLDRLGIHNFYLTVHFRMTHQPIE